MSERHPRPWEPGGMAHVLACRECMAMIYVAFREVELRLGVFADGRSAIRADGLSLFAQVKASGFKPTREEVRWALSLTAGEGTPTDDATIDLVLAESGAPTVRHADMDTPTFVGHVLACRNCSCNIFTGFRLRELLGEGAAVKATTESMEKGEAAYAALKAAGFRPTRDEVLKELTRPVGEPVDIAVVDAIVSGAPAGEGTPPTLFGTEPHR